MVDSKNRTAELVVDGTATGQVLVCQEGLSFWGGVDPNSGKIIDFPSRTCFTFPLTIFYITLKVKSAIIAYV